jgi:hypothetical protein
MLNCTEADMVWYDIDEMEIDDDEQIRNREGRQFAMGQADQPKRLPMRRKDRWRQEEGVRAKTKKNDKKIRQRLKYNWQGE